MAPFMDLTLEQTRVVLRQNITDAEIKEIGDDAAWKYDATHELVERKRMSRVTGRNDVIMAAIMLTWNVTKNCDLDPNFMPSTESVWWICHSKTKCLDTCTHDHEWQVCINRRFSSDGRIKSGCPYCSSGGFGKFCPCQSLFP